MVSRWRWLLAQLLESVSVLVVLAVLVGLAFLGQANDWKLPTWMTTASTPENANGPTPESAETKDTLPVDPQPPDPSSKPEINTERIKLKPGAATQAGFRLWKVAGSTSIQQVQAYGVLEYNQNRYANLSTRVPGIIWRADRRLGDSVGSGEVLAIVEAADVGRAKADFLQSVVQVAVRTVNMNRLQESSNVISEKAIRDAEAALREANIKLMADQQALNNLGLPIKLDAIKGRSDAELATYVRLLGLPDSVTKNADTATLTANLLPLKAPFKGEVVVRNAVVGEQATPATPIYAVADMSQLWVLLDVRREEASHLEIGQEMQFGPDGAAEPSLTDGNRAQGKIFWISPEVDPKTRTVKVRAEVSNPSGRMRPNTFGTGWITVRSTPNALMIPNEAIQSEGDQQFVFVHVTDQEYQPRVVQLGVRKDGATEIVSGLKAGDLVVTTGSFVLKTELFKDRLGGGD
jgi:cobalt-zinc-cadmium efflux system membrane fusion protein